MEAVEGELRCPVCLELFECPIILPCSHILCRTPCAERLFVRESIRCPVCRDNSFVTGGVASLPRVISLEHIIEQFRNPPDEVPTEESSTDDNEEEETVNGPDDIPCQLCDEDPPRKATKSCLHCNASYCMRCLSMSHPNKEPFTQHRLVEPRRYPKPKELRCPQHDAKVNIFCVDCQVMGCLLCADDPEAHPAHSIQTLEQTTVMFKVSTLNISPYLTICGSTLE